MKLFRPEEDLCKAQAAQSDRDVLVVTESKALKLFVLFSRVKSACTQFELLKLRQLRKTKTSPECDLQGETNEFKHPFRKNCTSVHSVHTLRTSCISCWRENCVVSAEARKNLLQNVDAECKCSELPSEHVQFWHDIHIWLCFSTHAKVHPANVSSTPGTYSIAPQISGRVCTHRKLPLPQICLTIEQLLPQVLPETRDVTSRQNKTDTGFREVRCVFAFQSEFLEFCVEFCVRVWWVSCFVGLQCLGRTKDCLV